MDIEKALGDLISHKEQGFNNCIAIDMAISEQEEPSKESRVALVSAFMDLLRAEKNRRAELKSEFNKHIAPLDF